MMVPKASSTSLKVKLTIPGVGEVRVGPKAVPMKKGEQSPHKIIEAFRKAQRGEYFSSPTNVIYD